MSFLRSCRRRQAAGGELGAQKQLLKPSTLVEAKHAPGGLPMVSEGITKISSQKQFTRIIIFGMADASAAIIQAYVVPSQRQGFAEAHAGVQEEFEQQRQFGVDGFGLL